MTISLGLHRSALVLLVCAGCNSSPEIVASTTSDGFIDPGKSNSQCRPGQYKGSFYTNEGEWLSLSGPMAFSLVLSTDKEIVQIGPNTVLSGMDPATHASFTATVETKACSEGKYVTQLKDGLFTYPYADGTPFIEAPFRGTIRGEYLDRGEVFFGTWDTAREDGSSLDAGTAQKLLSGRWTASWFADVDGGT